MYKLTILEELVILDLVDLLSDSGLRVEDFGSGVEGSGLRV